MELVFFQWKASKITKIIVEIKNIKFELVTKRKTTCFEDLVVLCDFPRTRGSEKEQEYEMAWKTRMFPQKEILVVTEFKRGTKEITNAKKRFEKLFAQNIHQMINWSGRSARRCFVFRTKNVTNHLSSYEGI